MVWLKLIFFIIISFSLKAENTQNIHDTYFNFLDLNNDGYVSHEEIEQIKNIVFELIDINNDNKISSEELDELNKIVNLFQ